MTTKAKKDYSKGKIYKIEPTIDHDEGDIYIGSTAQKYLCQRMTQHRNNYNRWKKGLSGRSMSYCLFEKYGVENCAIHLLENVNALNSDELSSREVYYIKMVKCINKCIPLRTKVEYYQDNKENFHVSYNQYYAENKEKILNTRKQYRENNAQKIKDYKKQYREMNRDKINENQRIAYQKKRQEEENETNTLEIII